MAKKKNEFHVIVGRHDVPMSEAGRIALPEDWDFIVANNRVVHLVPDPNEECLAIVPDALMQQQLALLEKGSRMSAKDVAFTRKWTSSAVRFEVDDSLAIEIPEALREYAGLKNAVAMIGAIRIIKVWDPERLSSQNVETDDPRLKAVLDDLFGEEV